MEKIINSLINNWTKGVDTYTHNGSTWLIFTDSKKWVIELTDSKTLWYNYNFFKQIFEFTSLDVVEHQSYITKWVEDNVINKVSDIRFRDARGKKHQFEDALENGVRHTDILESGRTDSVEDTIQNGVKSTISTLRPTLFGVDDIIQDGIKETRLEMNITEGEVDDIIQDGVRDISPMTQYTDWQVEEIIENGVKNIRGIENDRSFFIEDTLEMGVKETNHIKNNVRETKHFEEHLADTIDGVINEGVKETIECNWNIPKYVINEVVNDGVKETSHKCLLKRGEIEDIIDSGVKDIKGLGKSEVTEKEINNTIQNGVKETNYDTDNYTDDVKEVIREGVKETKTPGNGDIASTAEWMKENNSTSYPKMIDDVIENGVKEIRPSGCVDKKTGIFHYRIQEEVDDVVDNGVKKTRTPNKDGDIQSALEWMYNNNCEMFDVPKIINNVIENGVKEVISYDEHKRGPVNTFGYIDDIIKEGEKINGTYAGGQRQSEKCKSVVEYGKQI